MELVLLATCNQGSCPTIYATEDGHVLVQGEPIAATEMSVDVPAHERLVRIPRSVLLDAAAQLAGAV